MTFEIPDAAEEVTELGYPYCPIRQGHATCIPLGESEFKRHYIFQQPLADALEKTEGYGEWAFWPPYQPEYIVFEKQNAAIMFRLYYNP